MAEKERKEDKNSSDRQAAGQKFTNEEWKLIQDFRDYIKARLMTPNS